MMGSVLPCLLLAGLALYAATANALDKDGDGMSDVWQRIYNIASGDAYSDPDGDGYTNAQEALAGTNPFDPTSRLMVNSFSVTATTAMLTWKSEIGKKYDIEVSSDLLIWTHNAYADGDGSNFTATITVAAAQRGFFRVRVLAAADDSDGDTLNDWEESLLGTNKNSADTDGDGLPDGWEFIHHLDANNPSDASADPDGDGWTNLQEWLTGGDPLDANIGPSFPAAQIVGDGAQNERKSKQATFTLPAGNQSYIVVVAVKTDEYPDWTSQSSQYDNVADWNISTESGPLMQGSVSVNSLHTALTQSELGGTSYLGLAPYAIVATGTVQASPANPTQVYLEVGATNVSDGEFPTTVVAALTPVELTWEAKGDWNNVDDHKDPFTDKIVGKRIFPDAPEPSGGMRRELNLKVRIAGLANQKVYLTVFDVDDPTPLPDPDHKLDPNDTDSKKAGDDNILGAGPIFDYGQFLPQEDLEVAVDLDSSGEAKIEFQVNQQPGNNFRVAVAINYADLDYLQVSDSNAQGYVSPDDQQVSGFIGGISTMLTVWRKLHMEIDSMKAPVEPKAPPDHVTVTADHWGTDAMGHHVLYLASNLPRGNNFYEYGRIKSGTAELVIHSNEVGWIALTTIGQNPTQAQLDSFLGSIEVFDDDDKGLAGPDLPKATLISQGVKDIYKRAFIDIVDVPESKNPNPRLDYEQYVSDLVPWTPLNDKKDTHGEDSVAYWNYYAVAAYQPVETYAGDPLNVTNANDLVEGMTRWGGWFTYDFTVIYTESIRESVQVTTDPKSPTFGTEYQTRLDEVVAHEIGHVPKRKEGHYESGLMANQAPSHNFSAESLRRFRQTPSWGASW